MSKDPVIRMIRLPSGDEGRMGYRPPKAVAPVVKGDDKPVAKPVEGAPKGEKNGS